MDHRLPRVESQMPQARERGGTVAGLDVVKPDVSGAAWRPRIPLEPPGHVKPQPWGMEQQDGAAWLVGSGRKFG